VRAVKKNEEFRDIPVIFISAKKTAATSAPARGRRKPTTSPSPSTWSACSRASRRSSVRPAPGRLANADGAPRADLLVQLRGLAESRSKAQR